MRIHIAMKNTRERMSAFGRKPPVRRLHENQTHDKELGR